MNVIAMVHRHSVARCPRFRRFAPTGDSSLFPRLIRLPIFVLVVLLRRCRSSSPVSSLRFGPVPSSLAGRSPQPRPRADAPSYRDLTKIPTDLVRGSSSVNAKNIALGG